MKKKKLTAGEVHTKITEQRFAFAILLCNILDSDEVGNDVKSAVAASLLNTIEMSFILGDDDGLSNLINNSINNDVLLKTKNIVLNINLLRHKFILVHNKFLNCSF